MSVLNKDFKTGREPGECDTGRCVRQKEWPVRLERTELRWFPAGSRLIGLVRANVDKFVLPPAVVDEIARIAGYDNYEAAKAMGTELWVSLVWESIFASEAEPKKAEAVGGHK